MSVKTLYPLCVQDSDARGACFDVATVSLKSGGARMSQKAFSKILQWDYMYVVCFWLKLKMGLSELSAKTIFGQIIVVSPL